MNLYGSKISLNQNRWLIAKSFWVRASHLIQSNILSWWVTHSLFYSTVAARPFLTVCIGWC